MPSFQTPQVTYALCPRNRFWITESSFRYSWTFCFAKTRDLKEQCNCCHTEPFYESFFLLFSLVAPFKSIRHSSLLSSFYAWAKMATDQKPFKITSLLEWASCLTTLGKMHTTRKIVCIESGNRMNVPRWAAPEPKLRNTNGPKYSNKRWPDSPGYRVGGETVRSNRRHNSHI